MSISVIIYGSFRSLSIEDETNHLLTNEKAHSEEDDCFIQTKQQEIIKSSSKANLADSFSNRSQAIDVNELGNLQTINSNVFNSLINLSVILM